MSPATRYTFRCNTTSIMKIYNFVILSGLLLFVFGVDNEVTFCRLWHTPLFYFCQINVWCLSNLSRLESLSSSQTSVSALQFSNVQLRDTPSRHRHGDIILVCDTIFQLAWKKWRHVDWIKPVWTGWKNALATKYFNVSRQRKMQQTARTWTFGRYELNYDKLIEVFP